MFFMKKSKFDSPSEFGASSYDNIDDKDVTNQKMRKLFIYFLHNRRIRFLTFFFAFLENLEKMGPFLLLRLWGSFFPFLTFTTTSLQSLLHPYHDSCIDAIYLIPDFTVDVYHFFRRENSFLLIIAVLLF